MGEKKPSRKRYPPELCERAVRMVADTIAERGQGSVNPSSSQVALIRERDRLANAGRSRAREHG